MALIASVMFCLWWIECARMPSRIKIFGRKPLNRKPFNCEYCLPVYLTPIFFFIPHPITTAIAYTFGAACLTTYFIRLLAKWNL